MRARNAIAPHDVGKRVAFQFNLPGGHLGEVVGTLEAYDRPTETYFVRKKDGRLARVSAQNVRFGKIVCE
jgi:hypothetical protein